MIEMPVMYRRIVQDDGKLQKLADTKQTRPRTSVMTINKNANKPQAIGNLFRTYQNVVNTKRLYWIRPERCKLQGLLDNRLQQLEEP